MNGLRCYVGYDPREDEAFQVAVRSLQAYASAMVSVSAIHLDRCEAWGLMHRPWRIYRGSIWDVPSNAPASTQFAASRFLTPMLAQSGWALFTDCDVLFLADVLELLAIADPRYAVQVVKHAPLPTEGTKMDGQVQTAYPRKNWSSVMLFNCDHPGHLRLNLEAISGRPGRDLHAFCWLEDDEIGELPPEWNWLVGVQPKPDRPKLAHYTLGGPWLPGWEAAHHDELWLEHQRRFSGAR